MRDLIGHLGMERIDRMDGALMNKFGEENRQLISTLASFHAGKATVYHFNPLGQAVTSKKGIHLVAVFDGGDQEGDYQKTRAKFKALQEFSLNGMFAGGDYGVSEGHTGFPYTVSFSPLSSVRSGWRKISLTKLRELFSRDKLQLYLHLTTQKDFNERLYKEWGATQ